MSKCNLTSAEKKERVGELMVAKQAHDIDALVALYHPDCLIEQPSLGVYRRGHAAIRPGLEDFAKHFPDYERAFEGFAMDEDTLVSWGMAKVTLTGEFGDYVANGKRAKLMTFVTFKFKGDRIIHEGHYWDLATIARTSGIPADAILDLRPIES